MNFKSIFNQSNLIAFFKTAKNKNISTLIYRCQQSLKDSLQYPKWFQQHAPTTDQLTIESNHIFSYNPMISIVVPTYCTPIPFLHEMIQSVLNQTYSNWELCIADASPADSDIRDILTSYSQNDSRIKVTFLTENKGISENTNHALALTTGDFIGLLDHDDILSPNALHEIALAINNNPSIDILYTDEDKIDSESQTHYYPNFKPDYNEFLLRSCNYICHFFVFKRTIFEQVGLFDPVFDGSQDYHYILRATRIAKQIHHIPKMLYHWRVHNGSVASNPEQKSYCYDAAKHALQENLDMLNISGTVNFSRLIGFYNTAYDLPNNISTLIIALDSAFSMPDSHSSNIIICHATSISDIKQLIRKSECDYCIILNKGVTELPNHSINQILSYFQNKNIGAVTPKIINKKSILSMGATFTKNRIVNCYHSIPKEDVGYYGRTILDQNVPLLSSYAFCCKRTNLEKILDLSLSTNMENLCILLSLSLMKENLSIIGAANVAVTCTSISSQQPDQELIEKHKKELHKASKLYAIPPY